MNILLVSPMPPPEGGMATWTMQYMDYCESSNISVILVNSALVGKRKNRINSRRNLWDEFLRTINILHDFTAKLRSEDSDIVHINSSCSKFGLLRDAICVKLAKRKQKIVVFHCHCNVEDALGISYVSRYVFRRIVSKSDRILVLNSISFEFVRKFTNPFKVITTPNFFQPKETQRSIFINECVKNVIFVGHIQREKGIGELYKVAIDFPDISFHLVGPVSQEIEKWKCPGNVFLHGKVEHKDIFELLRKSDLFIFPSYSEGFSLAMLEAMSVGLPIIATDVGANRDMIEECGGRLVAPKNESSIKSALISLFDKSMRESMSQWNFQKVRKDFSVEKVVDELIAMYSELLLMKQK